MSIMTVDDVQRLASIVKKEGLTSLEYAGVKITRDPKIDFNAGIAETFASVNQGVSDEDILMNPLVGLERMSNG